MDYTKLRHWATRASDSILLTMDSIGNGTFLTLDTQPERIRTYDQDGNLTSAGLTWWELSESAEQWSNIIKLLAAVPFAIILMGMGGSSNTSSQAQSAFLVFAAIVAAAYFVLSMFAWKDCGIIFHRDGRIEAPYGLLLKARLRRFGGQAQLASVEGHGGAVTLWSRDGYSLTLTRRRHSDHYTKSLAILVNTAFHDMQDARRIESEKRMGGDAPMRQSIA